MAREELLEVSRLIDAIKTDDRLIFTVLALLIVAPAVAVAVAVTL